jgi:hypothetical protein
LIRQWVYGQEAIRNSCSVVASPPWSLYNRFTVIWLGRKITKQQAYRESDLDVLSDSGQPEPWQVVRGAKHTPPRRDRGVWAAKIQTETPPFALKGGTGINLFIRDMPRGYEEMAGPLWFYSRH